MSKALVILKNRGILFFLGIYTLLVSLFSAVNIFYSIYFDFFIGLNSYLITLSISLVLGLIFFFVGRDYSKNITLIEQLIFILLGFFLIPLLISIPYSLSILNLYLDLLLLAFQSSQILMILMNLFFYGDQVLNGWEVFYF